MRWRFKNGYQTIRFTVNDYFTDGAIDPNGTNTSVYFEMGLTPAGAGYINTSGLGWWGTQYPASGRSIDLGTSALPWRNIYGRAYYINGIAFGDIVTHNSSEYAATSHTHTKSQITDFPTLATVATSGSYNDLSNKPTIPSDTHWTSHLYAGGSGATANAATSNGGTYLSICDNSTSRNSIKITGSGATTVASDANGNITISSTDTNTNTTYSAGTNMSLSGTQFSTSSTPSFTSVTVTNSNSAGLLFGSYRVYVG